MAGKGKEVASEPPQTVTVMRLELTSDSASDVDSVCSEMVSTLRRMGCPYGGPIPMPKQRIRNPDGTRTDIHTRILDIDTDDRAAGWLKSFSCPDTVRMRCTIIEKRR